MLFTKGNLAYGLLIVLIAVQVSKAEDAIQCVQCGGDGQQTCSMPLTVADCTNAESVSCFTKVDTSGKVSRGCLVNSDNDCTAVNNCQITGTKLNNHPVCKACDTTDADCSQTDMTIFTTKSIEFCSASQPQCRTNVNDKKVERGCATQAEITACTDAQTCKVCDTDFCNTGIFPTNRLHCYQCSGSSCNDVDTNQKSLPCLNYVAQDQCYTIGESATTMKRGCQSDDSSNTNPNECLVIKDSCLFCSTDNCNNLQYKHDQIRKCYQCTGNASNNECFKEQSSVDFKNCQNQIVYNAPEYCYTHVNGDNIERGCLHDNTELTVDSCKDDDVCTKCSDADGCNSKALSTDFTCIRCRSDIETKCWNNATSLTGSTCRNPDTSASDGCYHGIWNGIAIRGCYVDADERQQYICKDATNTQCRICNSKDCNTDNSSGANTIKMYFGLWLMIFTLLSYFK